MATANRAIVLAITAWIGLPATASAQVERYYAKMTSRGEMVLVGVSVRRGEKVVTFDAAKLVGVTVTHFKGTDTANIATVAGSNPPGMGGRGALIGDRLLNTGLINPGGQDEPLAGDPVLEGADPTPGLAVEFARPVVNLPGDDVVFFEFHTTVNSPIGGDAFHVSPLRFEAGLHSVTFQRLDITCDDPGALPLAGFDLYRFAKPVQSADELQAAPIKKGNSAPLMNFKVLAVGIDLSKLGYRDGAEVSGLFFQDKGTSGLQVDPVLIAGLPAVEPENLLAKIPEDVLSAPEPGELLRTMLEGPMAGIDRIVFAERVCGFDHWYANFGFYSASVAEYPPQRGIEGEEIPPLFGDGGRLCLFDLNTKGRTVILEDATGGIRDPQVDYDGRKILFSYRRGGQPYYHLHEIGTDGTGLTQLTDGPFDDIEPTYLPDGGIVFSSSRSNRFVNCYRTPVATLYACDGDGGNVHPISTNVEHDNTPWVLHDGRVLFMRWEYVDRSQFSFHHLWTVNPDGTGQMIFYGNQQDGMAMLDAKPIAGSNRVVASFSPGHGRPGHMGYVTVVDPSTGPDNLGAARRISQGGRMFRDPYPVSEDCFLVADNSGIHVMDGQGNTELVCRQPATETRLTCHEPRPVVRRLRERIIPPRTNPAGTTGRVFLGDIYQGRGMQGVKRGEIERLLILEQLPKPINFSGGMWPTSVGGTFTLSRILGTVPVEPDGSAYVELPARRPLFFVALDEAGLSVKRMQSFLSVEPGEVTGCVGCHEQRLQAPLFQSGNQAFLGRKPSRIEPIDDVPDVFDFPRDVQPIFDRHCVECHNPDRREGGVDLCGDHTPLFSVGFWNLMRYGLVADGRNERHGNRPPRSIGSSASRLLEFLDGSHYDAKLSQRDRRLLRLWIDSSAVYAGTYAALGSGMFPVELPTSVLERRCGECHAHERPANPLGTGRYFRFGETGPPLPLVHEFADLQQIRGSIGYYKFGNARPPQSLCNLSRPEKSLLFRAPLSPQAGGLGLCEQSVFADTSDADYQTILANILVAKQRHDAEKRFDMPGFRPNVYYVRKMQEYGILPADLDANASVDIRAVDEAYWRSFWCETDSTR